MSAPLDELLKMSTEEILTHNDRPTGDELRTKQQLYYEDVYEGMELPKYIYNPTPTHLFRWSAAIENFHRIHYDLDFGMNHDKNPSILIHGSWKQSVVPQFLKDWTLPGGWPWKARFEHRAMLVPGDVVIMWGKVTSKQEKGGMGLIDLEIGMKTQDGIESMPGTATVVLPLKDGPEIPYPFVPPAD
jgi:acyl dehydratase